MSAATSLLRPSKCSFNRLEGRIADQDRQTGAERSKGEEEGVRYRERIIADMRTGRSLKRVTMGEEGVGCFKTKQRERADLGVLYLSLLLWLSVFVFLFLCLSHSHVVVPVLLPSVDHPIDDAVGHPLPRGSV